MLDLPEIVISVSLQLVKELFIFFYFPITIKTNQGSNPEIKQCEDGDPQRKRS